MRSNRWLLSFSALVVAGSVGRVVLNPVTSRGADRRIASDDLFRIEQESGKHIYAPTWLPQGGRVGEAGLRQGANRMLQDFSAEDDRPMLIVAQESRTLVRDNYHQRIFVKRALARADVNGKPGYIVTGSSGERRLFWNEEDAAIILSSMILDDADLVKIAQNMR